MNEILCIIEKVKQMAESIRRNLQIITSVVAIILGLASICTLVYKGGAFIKEFELWKEANRKEVAALEARIVSIENGGSKTVAQHIQVDDVREAMIRERLARLDAIAEMVPGLATKLAVIDVKLDDLKTSLDKHEKNTTPK